jgi:hypothetical protein
VPGIDALVGQVRLGQRPFFRSGQRAAGAARRLLHGWTALYRAILEDVAEVRRRIPRERVHYALEIPYIARENSAAEILALRKAWARAAG